MMQPSRSRSSHSLNVEKARLKRPESPYNLVSRAMTRQISIPQKYEKSDSSRFSNFSGSSSTLSSDSKQIKHEQDLTGTYYPYIKFTTPIGKSQQLLTTTFSTKSSPNRFLPSPRQSRSRSSHSPVKRRAESPTEKHSSSRHGWLYTQQNTCPADVAKGRKGRITNNNPVR